MLRILILSCALALIIPASAMSAPGIMVALAGERKPAKKSPPPSDKIVIKVKGGKVTGVEKRPGRGKSKKK